MANEEVIVGMFKQIMGKLDEHSEILHEHTTLLNEHSKILHEHTIFLNEHSQLLNEHSKTLGEHSQVLSALRTDKEYLKTEIDGMQISHAKEFGVVKSGMDDQKIDIKILKDQIWENKADIERIKNVMGIG